MPLFFPIQKLSIHVLSDTKQQLRDSNENIFKRFFKAGVTPDFAENAKDADILEGQ